MPARGWPRHHPEWILGGAKGGLLNLGNPEAWAWLVNHVDKLLVEQRIGLYRQDFNIDPSPSGAPPTPRPAGHHGDQARHGLPCLLGRVAPPSSRDADRHMRQRRTPQRPGDPAARGAAVAQRPPSARNQSTVSNLWHRLLDTLFRPAHARCLERLVPDAQRAMPRAHLALRHAQRRNATTPWPEAWSIIGGNSVITVSRWEGMKPSPSGEGSSLPRRLLSAAGPRHGRQNRVRLFAGVRASRECRKRDAG